MQAQHSQDIDTSSNQNTQGEVPEFEKVKRIFQEVAAGDIKSQIEKLSEEFKNSPTGQDLLNNLESLIYIKEFSDKWQNEWSKEGRVNLTLAPIPVPSRDINETSSRRQQSSVLRPKPKEAIRYMEEIIKLSLNQSEQLAGILNEIVNFRTVPLSKGTFEKLIGRVFDATVTTTSGTGPTNTFLKHANLFNPNDNQSVEAALTENPLEYITNLITYLEKQKNSINKTGIIVSAVLAILSVGILAPLVAIATVTNNADMQVASIVLLSVLPAVFCICSAVFGCGMLADREKSDYLSPKYITETIQRLESLGQKIREKEEMKQGGEKQNPQKLQQTSSGTNPIDSIKDSKGKRVVDSFRELVTTQGNVETGQGNGQFTSI